MASIPTTSPTTSSTVLPTSPTAPPTPHKFSPITDNKLAVIDPFSVALGSYRLLEDWKNYEQYMIVSIPSPGDGSCFIHSFLNAFYINYRLQKDSNGKYVSRKEIVNRLRNRLADRLRSPSDPLFPDGPTIYDTLGNGEIKKMAKDNKEYTVDSLESRLRSNSFIGYEFIEFFCNEYSKDIYVLDDSKKDIYMFGHDTNLFKNRDSVVILFTGGNHFETIGVAGDGQIVTHFTASNPFIKFLQSRSKV